MAGFTLSEFVISAVELVEAQANDIRSSFEKSAGNILALCVVAAICIVGFIFLLIGLNLVYEIWVGEVASYFLTALTAFILAFLVYKVSSWKTK